MDVKRTMELIENDLKKIKELGNDNPNQEFFRGRACGAILALAFANKITHEEKERLLHLATKY